VSTDYEHHGLWLPGYTLSTKLGAGGYGEVWLAHAPGGLTKAVKFIYGSYHDKRAEHELKALQKVKEVRHPFLLSLERIEVVDGRLVIVTELADGSLKDRFDECVRQRLPGIPRDELLGYLRDAADALDFLSQKHHLQHLDVKPENLLLVAGHVKVADFGLVKDVGKSQASLVGGLTPLYSAPEVFQGSPSPNSDQYSLAVLYEEMLTSVLPFAGVTAAELTLQHLHDDPDLSPLPDADRYVLSRALSKDPAQRFGSCSELIASLLAGRDDKPAGFAAPVADHADAPPPRRVERGPRPVTELFGESAEAAAAELSQSMLLDIAPLADPQPKALPPLETPSTEFVAEPTLVIGVGGAAGEVLKQFRIQLAKQFGDERLPSVQLLLLDTDPKSIAKAVHGDARTALRPEETLSLPLRRPQEYRDQSSRLMRWLSRRWLYNIPRSLRTDGMRPLGRLAFADHARQVVQRIRMAMSQACEAESLAASQELTKLPFRPGAPRVYLVASISGGAGSGMSLDLGFAVRAALDKMGAVDAPIVGVFLHAAGKDPRHCDLAKVNSYAWLTEYNHFHRAGGQFPGDDSCGLPPAPAGRRAFDAAYLVDLEVDDQGDEATLGAAAIAEYLYLDVLTPAQAFFAACRRDESSPPGAAPLRTFAVRKTSAASDASIDLAAAALSRAVVLRWTGSSGARPGLPTGGGADDSLRDTNQIVQGAATLVAQLQLQLDNLAPHARSLVEAQFGGDQQTFLLDLFTALGPPGKATTLLEMTHAVDRLFAPPSDEASGSFVMQRPLEEIISPLSMKLASDLAKWVLQKIDDRQERLAGAQRAAQWLLDHLKKLESDAAHMAEGMARQAALLVDELRKDGRAARIDGAAAFSRASAYFRLRVDHQAVWASTLIARKLLAELKSVSQTLSEFGRHLKHLAANLPGESSAELDDDHVDVLKDALAANLRSLVDDVDGQLQQQFIDEQGGLFPTIMGNSRIRAQMLAALGKLARRTIEQLASRPDVLNSALAAIASGEPGGAAAHEPLPALLSQGGVYRRLAVVPSESAGGRPLDAWRSSLGPEVSLAAVAGADVVSVCEAWGLPLVHVAVQIIQSRRDYADFAARVYTRSDVEWRPLAATGAPPTVAATAFVEARDAGDPAEAPPLAGIAGLVGADLPTTLTQLT
jgi:hypothetical protein